MSEKIYVFAAGSSFAAAGERVYPAARAQEIASAQNEGVRAQKYQVWKLLEYALKKAFKADMRDLSFSRGEGGKWRAEGVEFSLSHSHGALAVALSRIPVGVDVELLDEERFSRPFARKLLSEGDAPCGGQTAAERCALWTKKEAIFKCAGSSVFRPEKIAVAALPTKTVRVSAEGETYLLTVAAGDLEDVLFEGCGVTIAPL